ncbi:MAG: sufurtransferase FdhD [Proteobacteria bacterium]|nr:MAG: sufurtransferase FdhD [Pseudomonadota bacterium]
MAALISINENPGGELNRIVPENPEVLALAAGRRPALSDAGLRPTGLVKIIDQAGVQRSVPAAVEHALTIRVDGDELVTLMTIGSVPEHLVLGYLRNQGLIRNLSQVESVRVNWERELAEVITVSGGGVSEPVDVDSPAPIHEPGLIRRSEIRRIVELVPRHNAVYRHAGSVHGCGLVRGGTMMRFVEDVGRHNATDAIAGWMWLEGQAGGDKVLYTTGRLTAEIAGKSAHMGIPAVISRNGVTRRAIELAEGAGVMLVARARRQGFQVFSCHDRLVLD